MKYLIFEENIHNHGRVDVWTEDGGDDDMDKLYKEYKQEDNTVVVMKLTPHLLLMLERVLTECGIDLSKVS